MALPPSAPPSAKDPGATWWSLKDLLHNTPAYPLTRVGTHGLVFDLLDAAQRAEDPNKNCVFAWIDGAIAYLSIAVISIARLVGDLALAIFFLPSWPFSLTGKTNCKIYALRAAVDLGGIAVGLIGAIYPLIASHLLPKLQQEELFGLMQGIAAGLRAPVWGSRGPNPVIAAVNRII
jgi:hypothetical protein